MTSRRSRPLGRAEAASTLMKLLRCKHNSSLRSLLSRAIFFLQSTCFLSFSSSSSFLSLSPSLLPALPPPSSPLSLLTLLLTLLLSFLPSQIHTNHPISHLWLGYLPSPVKLIETQKACNKCVSNNITHRPTYTHWFARAAVSNWWVKHKKQIISSL